MKKSVKMGLKIAGLSVAWIPASVGALATIDVPTSLNSKAPVNKRFFRNLAENYPKFATLPITNISMLGSHDALSDGITINSRNDPYSPNTTALSELARWVGPGAMVRLSRAQQDNIYTQLNAGVRYIDARITHISGNYYTHHTLLSNTLSSYLLQILQWLDENPGEFVFFHIYYFNYCKKTEHPDDPAAETTTEAWTNLLNFIKTVKYNGKSLLDYDYTLKASLEDESGATTCYFKDLNYDNVCPLDASSKRQAGAIMYFSSDTPSEASETDWCYKHIYHDGVKHIINPCAGSMKASNVVKNINDAVTKAQALSDDARKDYVRYCQTQTTPNIDDLPQTIAAWSLLQKAHGHNPYILRKAGIDWNEVFTYVPIYMCDFCTDNTNGFCQEVIDKMSAFNESLCK